MAVVIRLARQGAKHRDFWRMVVTDPRSPRDGRFIEQIGWYDPLTSPPTVQVKADRVRYWLGVGAQPSEKVRALLKRSGALKPGADAPGQPAAGGRETEAAAPSGDAGSTPAA